MKRLVYYTEWGHDEHRAGYSRKLYFNDGSIEQDFISNKDLYPLPPNQENSTKGLLERLKSLLKFIEAAGIRAYNDFYLVKWARKK